MAIGTTGNGGQPRAPFILLAQSIATASGLRLFTVFMIQGAGYAPPILPYHASPIVVAMGTGKIPFTGRCL
jgi:hypothetical protein